MIRTVRKNWKLKYNHNLLHQNKGKLFEYEIIFYNFVSVWTIPYFDKKNIILTFQMSIWKQILTENVKKGGDGV